MNSDGYDRYRLVAIVQAVAGTLAGATLNSGGPPTFAREVLGNVYWNQ
jgi:hypothetical protein